MVQVITIYRPGEQETLFIGTCPQPPAIPEFSTIGLILTLLAVAASYFINQTALAVVILTSVLLYLYSVRVKKIALLGNITVAYLTGLAFIFGGISVNNLKKLALTNCHGFAGISIFE